MPGTSGLDAPTTGSLSYVYDYGQTANPALRRGRLTGETSTRSNASYTVASGYDGDTTAPSYTPTTGVGNLTSLRGVSATYNADNQNAALPCDGDGSPSAYLGNALQFDPEDRLTRYGALGSFRYTAGGLRAWKQTPAGSDVCLYDGDTLVCQFNADGTLNAAMTVGANGLLSQRTLAAPAASLSTPTTPAAMSPSGRPRPATPTTPSTPTGGGR